MNKYNLQSDLLLSITALIWGLAFVAQRIGMDYVGPFTFTGIRFALGSLVLVPFMLKSQRAETKSSPPKQSLKKLLAGSGLAGVILFGGASLQQVGMVYTTAGKAGFITGLYVIIVPIIAMFFKRKSQTGTWVGASLAAIGLYLLSVTASFKIAWGDLLVLGGAFFWALHVIVIGWLAPKHNVTKLAFLQFNICALLSLLTAGIFESITWQGLQGAAGAILYGGLFSVGIGYSLQVVAQKNVHPAHAAIIMSLEAVFAALGGWIILAERLTPRSLMGCALMLMGMLLSQLHAFWDRSRASVQN
jgi:drug/metabolite transporter (DMT)-like permease